MATRMLWNPMNELTSFQREIDRILGGADRNRCAAGCAAVGQDQDKYVAEFLLPGVDPSSINITLEKNELKINARRSGETEQDKVVRYIRQERTNGAYEQRVHLPENVDREKISADYHNGVLLLTLPKAEAAKPRQIQVKVG